MKLSRSKMSEVLQNTKVFGMSVGESICVCVFVHISINIVSSGHQRYKHSDKIKMPSEGQNN